MNKFFEWVDIAQKNNTKVSKEIPDSNLIARASWLENENFYTAKNVIILWFDASVSSNNNGKDSALILHSTKVTSSENAYRTYEIGTIFIMYDEVKEIQNFIKQSNIDAKIKSAKESKAKQDDLFK